MDDNDTDDKPTWTIGKEGFIDRITINGVDVPEAMGLKVGDKMPSEQKETQTYDNEGNASHYEGKIECIDYIRDRLTREQYIGYLRGTIVKYQHRLGEKDDAELDARKIAWYAKKLHEAYKEVL